MTTYLRLCSIIVSLKNKSLVTLDIFKLIFAHDNINFKITVMCVTEKRILDIFSMSFSRELITNYSFNP